MGHTIRDRALQKLVLEHQLQEVFTEESGHSELRVVLFPPNIDDLFTRFDTILLFLQHGIKNIFSTTPSTRSYKFIELFFVLSLRPVFNVYGGFEVSPDDENTENQVKQDTNTRESHTESEERIHTALLELTCGFIGQRVKMDSKSFRVGLVVQVRQIELIGRGWYRVVCRVRVEMDSLGR